MSQPVLLKVYGSFYPADQAMLESIRQLTASALPQAPDLELEGDLLKITFEGIYFPVDELLEFVDGNPGLEGKLDALDIENWQLRRYLVTDGKISFHSAPLNDVLAYSGH